MDINLIGFDVTLGRKKPENIVHRDAACPFCDREHLTGIIDTDGDIILLKNKYNVIEGAEQFVLIEGRLCHSDMPDYPPEYMRRLIAFGVAHWQRMLRDERYGTVLFFKNFGHLAGGTIRHPHMQLIGFYPGQINPALMFTPEEFQGLTIDKKNGVEFNVSTCPRIGFSELNIVPSDGSHIDNVADYIQVAVDYLMHHFNHFCDSYNIFFYHQDARMYIKVMPRFATSPLFIGYNIHFRANNLEALAADIQKIYFTQHF